MRYRNIKKEILGLFFAFFFFFNFFLIRIFFSFKNGFIYFLYFLNGLIKYIIDFLKVRTYYLFKKLTYFIETKAYKRIRIKKKK
jgi:hypothetical protein